MSRKTKRPLHIDVEDLVVELFADLCDRSVKRRKTGIVDQYINTAETIVHRVDQSVALVPIPDMAGKRHCGPTRLFFNFLSQFFAGVDLPARDHDVCARIRKGKHNLAAEPSAAASNDGNLAAQVEMVRRHSTLLERIFGENA